MVPVTFILKIIKNGSSIKLIATSEGNIILLAVIVEDSVIDVLFIHKSRIFKGVGDSDNKINDIDIINVNNIRSIKVKSTKSKNLTQLKELVISFFTPKTRFAFIKASI